MVYDHKRIKDICRFIGGSQPPKSMFIYEPRDGYVRLIQTRDRLNDDYITFIPNDTTTKLCEITDILIGRYGPPIFQIFRGFSGAYNVALMKAEPLNGVDKDYLYYFLKQKSVLKYVDSMSARTGGQTGVELDSLYEFPVLLPEINGQEKISKVLKAIDDKISNIANVEYELETICKLVFNYWFLQFDYPDMNGKPYKSSGGKMVWNEELKREIPEGWSCKTLDYIGRIESVNVTPQNDCQYSHFSIPAFDDKHMPVVEYGSEIDSGKYQVPSNSILISKLNPQFKRLWLIGEAPENSVCSTEFMPFVSTNNTLEFLYETLNSDAFYTYMVNCSSSSTGSRKRMQPELCSAFKIPYPDDDSIIADYCKKVHAMLQKAIATFKESSELVALRDFLLPLLMNGQVTFKNVE